MNIKATPEEIAAAQAYQGLHVPALFQQWAPRVVDAAGIESGHRVLDIACGTGVLAQEAAKRAGKDSLVTGLDASEGMLSVAGQMAPAIDWRQGLAESLPFKSESFNSVVSQFGLMFFQDRVGALREMRRVLTSGGRAAIAVWESLENSEAYPQAVALLERLAGEDAANALRAPFVLGDREELAALFEDAGFDSVEIKTYTGTGRFPSIRTMVEADLRGWLPVMGVNLSEEQIEIILNEAENALSEFLAADGTVEFDSPAHIITAIK